MMWHASEWGWRITGWPWHNVGLRNPSEPLQALHALGEAMLNVGDYFVNIAEDLTQDHLHVGPDDLLQCWIFQHLLCRSL